MEEGELEIPPHHVPPSKIKINSREDFYSCLRVCEYFCLGTMPVAIFAALVELRGILEEEHIVITNTVLVERDGVLVKEDIVTKPVFYNICRAVMDSDDKDEWIDAIVSTGVHGHTRVLQYLLDTEEDECLLGYAMCAAVAKPSYSVMRWVDERLANKDDPTFMTSAAGEGNVTEMEWLRKRGYPMNTDTLNTAIHHKKPKAIKWLLAQKCPMDESTTQACAYANGLHLLQRLRKLGCPWTEDVMLACMYDDNLSIFQWAAENGCPMRDASLAASIRQNADSIMEYILDNNLVVPTEEFPTLAMFQNNCIALEKLLDDMWCPVRSDFCELAAKNGRHDPLRAFLDHERTNPANEVTFVAVMEAAQNGHLPCLEAMYMDATKELFTDEDVFVLATDADQPAILDFLIDHGAIVSEAAAGRAMSYGNLESLKVVVTHLNMKTVIQQYCTMAGVHHHLPIVKYLHDYGFMENWESGEKRVFLKGAVEARKYDVVEFLRSKGFHLSSACFDLLLEHTMEIEESTKKMMRAEV